MGRGSEKGGDKGWPTNRAGYSCTCFDKGMRDRMHDATMCARVRGLYSAILHAPAPFQMLCVREKTKRPPGSQTSREYVYSCKPQQQQHDGWWRTADLASGMHPCPET